MELIYASIINENGFLKKSFQSYKSRIWMDVKKMHSLVGPSLLLSFSAHSLLSVLISHQDEVTNVFIFLHHLTECPQTVPPFSQSFAPSCAVQV